MKDAILVLNAGSSSLKFSLFVADGNNLALDVGGRVEGLHVAPSFIARDAHGHVVSEQAWREGELAGHDGALAHLRGFLHGELKDVRLLGVGHRVVHGGVDYRHPVRVDEAVLAALQSLAPLAPLHQPPNLAPIRALMRSEPQLPQVACFDTAFHAGAAPVTQMYGLPWELTEAGVRRYGFHGLSYEYIASVLPGFDARAAAGRTVVLHLGNGASMCALHGGRSAASTMGFTALEGLPMGTRCGTLDPGVILYLQNERGMTVREVEHMLYHRSGLLGVSGVSSDMRALLASSQPRAQLALDLYVYRIRRELGSLAAALGGLDALVFTAGIGENAAPIRARVCRDAAWLGVALDEPANEAGGPRISTPDSAAAAWVIPTNEELMIARHTLRVISGS